MKGHFSSSDKITLLPFAHPQQHRGRQHPPAYPAEDPHQAGPDLEVAGAVERQGEEEDPEGGESEAILLSTSRRGSNSSKDFKKLWLLSLLLTVCLTLLVVFSLLWLGGIFNDSMSRQREVAAAEGGLVVQYSFILNYT